MADDSDLEKTEPASPRRLEKAREEGQVARSRELGSFLALVCGISALWWGGREMYLVLTAVLRTGLGFDRGLVEAPAAMLILAGHSAGQALWLLLPIFALLLGVGIFSSVALGGLLFSPTALAPRFGRLNPLKGVGRLFSLQVLIELAKILAKATLVVCVGVVVIRAFLDEILGLPQRSPGEALAHGLGLVAQCCLLIALSLALVVLIDVPWQLWNHARQLRMSREDVRQEHKEDEGDPHVKGRLRQQRRAMARRRMMSAIPQADVVITNPTHFAVALRYREGYGSAPVVVAKGADLVAAQIRRLAHEHRIATLEAAPLARALYRSVDLDQEIPASLYAAVAEVLAWVYRLRNWEQGLGVRPETPHDLPVPAGLE